MLILYTLGVVVALCNGDPRTINFNEFGKTISIPCTAKRVTADNETYVRHWVVPDYKIDGESIMLANESHDMSATSMESDGWQLNVGWIRHTEAGKYTCVWQDGGVEQMDEIELKFNAPPQWSLYKDNVTVGLIATAVAIVVLVLIFLVWYFRWRDPEAEDKTLQFTSNGVEQQEAAAYENQAYSTVEPAQVLHRTSGAISESKM